MNNIKNFWENIEPTFAHLQIDKWLTDKNHLFNSWKKYFIEFIDFNNKIVIDYGIGGGYLGELLFTEYNIKKYIGIDISERSINTAKSNLKDYNCEFYLTPIIFDTLQADIFITQAVIQHFPDLDYLNDFLINVNNSKCKDLMLQIRHSDKTFINQNNYLTVNDAVRKCNTNKEYINTFLSNYELIKYSDIHSNGYQFLFYKLK